MEMRALSRKPATFIGTPNNLPRYLTSFVGRGSEISALRSMLAHSRMVTVTGPGGAGKSRLAAEVGRTSLPRWPDGIWWVELAPVNDPRQVASTAVAVLELPGHGPAEDRLIAWLAGRQALLVLDNCEHLVAACAEFCLAVLDGCPEVTILATSREPVGVAGEARWPLSPLAARDAIALFEARARLALPDFKVATSNREAVGEICEHLDRLPLAIELAAARIDVMAEQKILDQLSGDRFRLLTGGSRSDPYRLQTMYAAVDWSYRLLTDEEATLFRRLSVFRGGFTLDSAEALCAGGAHSTVLDLLAGLVHKSMVVSARDEGSDSRYRLLESQVAYGEDRLREAGELELARLRHYEHFSRGLSAKTTAEYAGRRPRAGPRPGYVEAQWIARESANLWAAMAWGQNNADDLGLGLAANLAILRLGDLRQLRSLLEELLLRSPATGHCRLYALGSASHVAYKQADYAAALAHAEAAVALARSLGDNEEVAQALHAAGIAHMNRAELDQAANKLEEAGSLLSNSSNRRLVNFIRNAIAHVAIRRGHYAMARDIVAECLVTSRAEGDVSTTAYYLDTLAAAQRGLNDFQATAATSREALSIQRGMKNQFGIIDALESLSIVAEADEDDQRALRLAAVTTRLSADLSYGADSWWSDQREQSRRRARARLGVRASEQAWNEGWSMSLDQAADHAMGEGEPETVAEADRLSRRQREVAELVAAGMTNRQIGDRLFISERTVEGHVERIRAELGARSRTEVATWAVEHRLTLGAPSARR